MLRNYLSIWLSTLARHKVSTLISLLSLGLGLACAIFIAAFIRDELSYDRWIPGSENLYRVEVSISFPGSPPIATPSAPFVLADALKSQVPEAIAATPFVPQRMGVSVGNRKYLETIVFVDPQFFQMFRLPLVAGNAAQVLSGPESAVISASLAKKLFGKDSPLNKNILLNGEHTLAVAGVMADLPYNTQLTGDVFVPVTSLALPLPQRAREDWMAFVRYVYVALAPGSDVQAVSGKILGLFAKSLNPDLLSSLRVRADQLVSVRVVRFGDSHLSTVDYGGSTPGTTSSTTVYGFGAIAILILIVACSNFASVAIAQSTMRAREIGMRKVVGAQRSQLIAQFILESLLLTAFAFLLAAALTEVLFPLFVRVVGHDLPLETPQLILPIAAITLLTGLAAGFYPALVLSRFSPSVTLKSGAAPQVRGGRLRRFVVTFQFAVSIALAVAAIVIFLQIRYARQFDLGFQHDNVVVVDTSLYPGISDSTRETYLDQLAKNPAIVAVTASAAVPFESSDSRGTVSLPGNPNTFFARSLKIRADFSSVYGLRLLAGRLLSRAYGQDLTNFRGSGPTEEGHNVMINATAAAQFGFSPAQALGKTIQVGALVRIVGVVADPLLHGVDEPEVPTIFYYSTEGLPKLSIRVKGDQMGPALAAIDGTWQNVVPGLPIDRHLLDDDFRKLFSEHEKQGTAFSAFSILTVIVACLGLFGLSAFTMQRDAKEIGLRRAFGASPAAIMRWQLARFSMLVVLACLVAWPIVAYGLHRWLQGFAHRIELSPVIFLLVGLGALGIAWITVIGHVIYAGRLKLVEVLRYE